MRRSTVLLAVTATLLFTPPQASANSHLIVTLHLKAALYLEVGKYYVFTKGNFEQGLPLLAKCGDPVLKQLAERDLARPWQARQQADLADDWYSRGEAEQGLAQRQSFLRAYYWYQTALPNLEGLTKVRIGRQVEALAKRFPGGSGAALPVEITTEVRAISVTQRGDETYAVAMSGDGKWLLVCLEKNTMSLWDAKTGQKIRDFLTPNVYSYLVAISPDKKWGLTGSSDKHVRLWNLETGQEVRRFPGHKGSLYAVQFLAAGQQVASAAEDGALRIFERDTGKLLKTLTGHTGAISCLSLSKDGKRAITGGEDKSVRVWDLETGQEVRKFLHPTPVQVVLSPEGQRAVTSSGDHLVKVWEVNTGKLLHTLANPGQVERVAISPDGQRVYASFQVANSFRRRSQIQVFNLHTGKELRQLGGDDYVSGLSFSADGRFLVYGNGHNIVRVWGAK